MSVITNNLLLGDEGYFLTKSLRFRSSATAYLSRTFAANPTTRTQQTFSFWTKRGSLGSTQVLFGGYDGSSVGAFLFNFTSSDTLQFFYGGSAANNIITTQVFRDPSAWYHIVASIDSTQATASNRVKIYINGVQITSFGTTNYPPQNTLMQFALNNGNNKICHNWDNASNPPYDGYMAEINFIDGQALTPSSFGETSTSTGVWIPKKYTGTYGTNGFYLDFKDTSSVAALGYDAAGSNDWTVNNISLTSGSTYDSMKDVPTLTDTDTANYCTWNPLAVGTNITTASGNLNATASSNSNAMLQGTFGITSGKWYWEVTLSSGTSAWAGSIIKSTAGLNYSSLSSGDAYSYSNDGSKYNGQTSTSYGNTYTTNDVISVAYNADTGKIWYAKNGTWQASGDPAAGTNEAYSGISGTYMPSALLNSATGIANFGQRPFAYTPPTGFVALNTFNLPTPTIGATASTTANEYFDATTYTGTGSSLSITNSGAMQPDLVWIKIRNQAFDHTLVDAVRGTSKDLESNTTGSEQTRSTVTAFNSNGFTVGTDSQVNSNGNTFVAWQWKANGSGSTNTAGSITSTVSANTTAGFSIAIYTGNGSTGATIGHGLGVTPSMVICKKRSSTGNWITYHTSTGINQYLYLNSTSASNTASPTWGVSSTTVTFQQLFSDYNDSGVTYVAYCFAQVAGYSAFGSYTGNGSTNGTFVYTGFRPRFVLIKKIQTGLGNGEWYIHDTARDNFNQAQFKLYPSSSVAENGVSGETTTTNAIDILSNGFKLRTGNGATNESSISYIYAAFAENPFKFSNAR